MNIDEFYLDEMEQKIGKQGRSINKVNNKSMSIELKADAVNINAVTNPKVLDIPTYDLNPSVGHPSIIYIPQGFKGYKYWMAYTPFPAEPRENPCIVVSNDGEHWINPPWFSNPLYSQANAVSDGVSYNSDVDIILMSNGKIGVYWRGYIQSPRREIIYLMTLAEDSNVWSPRIMAIDSALNIMSPSIVLENDKTYSMYSVSVNTVQKRTSIDGIHWSNPVNCILSTGIVIAPWHLTVKKISDGYILLVCNNKTNRSLNCYKSTDGITFMGSSIPLIKSSNSGWDNRGYYRSSFIVLEESPLKLWAFVNGEDGSGSAEYLDVWKIGSKIANKIPRYTNRNTSNLLTNPSLLTGVSGIATGFTKQNNATLTVLYTTDNAQKIEITGGTEVTAGKITQQIATINPLLKYKFSFLFKSIGDVNVNCYIDWFNGGSYVSTSILSPNGESSYEYDLFESALLTPPATATKCSLAFGVSPNAIGNIGTGWFKEVIFMVSS